MLHRLHGRDEFIIENLVALIYTIRMTSVVKIKNRKESIDPKRVRRYRIEYYEDSDKALFLRNLPKFQMSEFIRNAVEVAIYREMKKSK